MEAEAHVIALDQIWERSFFPSPLVGEGITLKGQCYQSEAALVPHQYQDLRGKGWLAGNSLIACDLAWGSVKPGRAG
jgi:hypothetical protein